MNAELLEKKPWKRKSRATPKADHKKTGRPRKDDGPRDRAGRPTVLTAARKVTIIRLVAAGNFISTAAAFAEVSHDAVEAAIKRGRLARSGPDREFTVALDKAHAEWTAQLVDATTQAALKSPDVALRMLNRRSKDWTDRELVVKHTGAVGTFDTEPDFGKAVRSDPVATAIFLDLLARLSDLGFFEPVASSEDRDQGALPASKHSANI